MAASHYGSIHSTNAIGPSNARTNRESFRGAALHGSGIQSHQVQQVYVSEVLL